VWGVSSLHHVALRRKGMGAAKKHLAIVFEWPHEGMGDRDDGKDGRSPSLSCSNGRGKALGAETMAKVGATPHHHVWVPMGRKTAAGVGHPVALSECPLVVPLSHQQTTDAPILLRRLVDIQDRS